MLQHLRNLGHAYIILPKHLLLLTQLCWAAMPDFSAFPCIFSHCCWDAFVANLALLRSWQLIRFVWINQQLKLHCLSNLQFSKMPSNLKITFFNQGTLKLCKLMILSGINYKNKSNIESTSRPKHWKHNGFVYLLVQYCDVITWFICIANFYGMKKLLILFIVT